MWLCKKWRWLWNGVDWNVMEWQPLDNGTRCSRKLNSSVNLRWWIFSWPPMFLLALQLSLCKYDEDLNCTCEGRSSKFSSLLGVLSGREAGRQLWSSYSVSSFLTRTSPLKNLHFHWNVQDFPPADRSLAAPQRTRGKHTVRTNRTLGSGSGCVSSTFSWAVSSVCTCNQDVLSCGARSIVWLVRKTFVFPPRWVFSTPSQESCWFASYEV